MARSELPSGTVTLLFTDIEGSTRLLHELGEERGAVFVAEHEHERGAQLLGKASSLREELGRGFDDALEERIHEQAVADAKAALGQEAFAAAWARGESMQPDEIITLCDDTSELQG